MKRRQHHRRNRANGGFSPQCWTAKKRRAQTPGLEVERVLSGPLGGDMQIGSRVAEGKVLCVLFFQDPLTPKPHEPDVQALMRVCNVHGVPLATNLEAAEALVPWLRDQAAT